MNYFTPPKSGRFSFFSLILTLFTADIPSFPAIHVDVLIHHPIPIRPSKYILCRAIWSFPSRPGVHLVFLPFSASFPLFFLRFFSPSLPLLEVFQSPRIGGAFRPLRDDGKGTATYLPIYVYFPCNFITLRYPGFCSYLFMGY